MSNQFLKEKREAKGLTRYRVCQDLGLAYNNYRRQEDQGFLNFRIDTVIRLCDRLGIDLDEYITKVREQIEKGEI